jgi:hypothetical protein
VGAEERRVRPGEEAGVEAREATDSAFNVVVRGFFCFGLCRMVDVALAWDCERVIRRVDAGCCGFVVSFGAVLGVDVDVSLRTVAGVEIEAVDLGLLFPIRCAGAMSSGSTNGRPDSVVLLGVNTSSSLACGSFADPLRFFVGRGEGSECVLGRFLFLELGDAGPFVAPGEPLGGVKGEGLREFLAEALSVPSPILTSPCSLSSLALLSALPKLAFDTVDCA